MHVCRRGLTHSHSVIRNCLHGSPGNPQSGEIFLWETLPSEPDFTACSSLSGPADLLLNISPQPTYFQDLPSDLGPGTHQLMAYNNMAISWRINWNFPRCPEVSSHLEVGLEECLRSSFWTWLSEGWSAGTSDGQGPGEEVKRVGEERTGLRSFRVARSEPSGRPRGHGVAAPSPLRISVTIKVMGLGQRVLHPGLAVKVAFGGLADCSIMCLIHRNSVSPKSTMSQL